jgi:hypothetical protein
MCNCLACAAAETLGDGAAHAAIDGAAMLIVFGRVAGAYDGLCPIHDRDLSLAVLAVCAAADHVHAPAVAAAQ